MKRSDEPSICRMKYARTPPTKPATAELEKNNATFDAISGMNVDL